MFFLEKSLTFGGEHFRNEEAEKKAPYLIASGICVKRKILIKLNMNLSSFLKFFLLFLSNVKTEGQPSINQFNISLGKCSGKSTNGTCVENSYLENYFLVKSKENNPADKKLSFSLILDCNSQEDFRICRTKQTHSSLAYNYMLSESIRSNLNRKPFRIAAVISSEYSYDTAITQLPNDSYQFEDSFAVALLKCLELTMNFTTIPIITTTWGYLLPNQSWTGMISLLLSDKADLGLSSIADRPFRRAVVDFNFPTSEIRLAAFFQKPSAISSEWNALTKPFRPQFWAVVFFTISLMIFTSILLGKASLDKESKESLDLSFKGQRWTTCFKKEVKVESDSSIWSLQDCIQWGFSTICLQGFYKVPYRIPFKILIIVGNIFGIVICSSYSGTLISFLSVVTEPIQNLGQLLATRYTFAVINNPIPLQFLSESPDAKTVLIYQKSTNVKQIFSSMKEAHDNLVKGSFVFVGDHSGAYETITNDFTLNEACRIREISIDFARQRQGTVIKRMSPYKRIIDYQILRMMQHGLIKRWNSKYLKRKPICETKAEYEGVEFKSTILAFGILLMGCIGGTCALVCEFRICSRTKIGSAGKKQIIAYP